MRAIYYDTETTGVRPDADRIIEIAAFDSKSGTSFSTLINPGCPIPKEASDIHQITDDMVEDAPTFAEAALEFQSFCEGDAVLIAHNNDAFDIHFLKKEYERSNLPFPEWKFLDSLKWARRYRPDLPRHSLQFLREIYSIPPNQAHRALDDVIVLAKVFGYMIDDLEIKEVYELLNAPRVLQHMPFGKYQGTPLQQVPKDYIAWLSSSGAFDKRGNEALKESLLALKLLQDPTIA